MDLLKALEVVERLKNECELVHVKVCVSNFNSEEIDKELKKVYNGLNGIETGLQEIAGWAEKESNEYETPSHKPGRVDYTDSIISTIQDMKISFNNLNNSVEPKGYRFVDRRNSNKVSQLKVKHQKNFKQVISGLTALHKAELVPQEVKGSGEEE